MIDLLLSPPFAAFTLALSLLFTLFLLELALLLVGVSLMGAGAEAAPDVDADFDVDLDADFANVDLAELGADLGDVDPEMLELFDAEPDISAPTESFSLAAWLGLGQVPALIWIASFLLCFGVSGLVLQQGAEWLAGLFVPPALAILVAAGAGLGLARSFSRLFARLLPKSETAAVSERHLGRRIGLVTQGVARRGKPAEVRVSDRHGNTHYLRAEPMKDADVIEAGTEVLVVRNRYADDYRLIAVSSKS